METWKLLYIIITHEQPGSETNKKLVISPQKIHSHRSMASNQEKKKSLLPIIVCPKFWTMK
uniref:Uncharacterized protein n=1 Tax=Rhizophora mucronata TaxID=61149 RepID=A0A2P2QMH7_RHIMU